MRLFKPASTDKTTPALPAHIASRWIEILAIPIASALMETQALFLLINLLITQVFGTSDSIGVNSILCILLFLHWWAMWEEVRRQRRGVQIEIPKRFPFTTFNILGIILVLVVFGLTHLSHLLDGVTPLFAIVLVGWAWKRGIDRTRAGYDEDQIILWFKIGFGILLFIMFFSLVGMADHAYDASNELLRNLPIFFLSGFIALSFTRIAAIRQERVRQQRPIKMAGTNRWLTTLTITWILLIIASIGTEFLPATLLISMLNPIWMLLGLLAQLLLTLLGWLIYIVFLGITLLIALLSRLFPADNSTQSPLPKFPPIPHSGPPPQSDGLEPILLLLAAIAFVIIMAIFIQKRRQQSKNDELEEEEIREGLNASQIRKERRQQRRQCQQNSKELIEEQPDSARARYRTFLLTMAEKDEHLARQAYETPAEYQQRLLLEAGRHLLASAEDAPPDATILARLTQAYSQERYGGKQIQAEQQHYLRQWVPHLLERLNTYLTVTPKNVPHHPYRTSRWGEDE